MRAVTQRAVPSSWRPGPIPPAQARPPRVRRTRVSRWWRGRVKPRPLPGGPAALGPLGRLPRRSAHAAVAQPSAPAVSGVCSNQVERQPHRVADGLHTKPDAPVAFAAAVAAVCAVSQHAPGGAQPGEPGSRSAAKTGIQAWERGAPTGPRPPGRVARPE